MDFVWNDGGRAACGFVGLTGDCVTRSIAIATGAKYQDVYDRLGKESEKSPRNGIQTEIAAAYLAEKEWERTQGFDRPLVIDELPQGVFILHLTKLYDRCPHFSTVIDHVVHDTWNPANDEYFIKSYWTGVAAQNRRKATGSRDQESATESQDLTQAEFDKILDRLRKLDRTANNCGSTESEKHNALRMMQSLMLRHNLTRDDMLDESNVDSIQFTRIACPVNGRRACNWEKNLAAYVTKTILPTTQWFSSSKGHRTLFWFYGPRSDVQNALALFRELLLTIATSAHLQFGGFTRGSGASYAEGYVQGLPTSSVEEKTSSEQIMSDLALIHSRTMTLQSAANQWLEYECNIKLSVTCRAGRDKFDEAAASRGRLHGSKHDIAVPGPQLRLGRK